MPVRDTLRSILCLLLLALGQAGAAIITAIPSQASASVGSSVRIDLSVSDVTDMYAFQLDLNFTPNILGAQNVTEAGYFGSNGVSFSAGAVNNNTGRITFIADSLSGNSPGFTGTTLLASIVYTAQTSGTAQVVPANVLLLNSNLGDIATTAAGSSITVTGTAPEPGSSVLILSGIAAALIVSRRKGLISVPTS